MEWLDSDIAGNTMLACLESMLCRNEKEFSAKPNATSASIETYTTDLFLYFVCQSTCRTLCFTRSELSYSRVVPCHVVRFLGQCTTDFQVGGRNPINAPPPTPLCDISSISKRPRHDPVISVAPRSWVLDGWNIEAKQGKPFVWSEIVLDTVQDVWPPRVMTGHIITPGLWWPLNGMKHRIWRHTNGCHWPATRWSACGDCHNLDLESVLLTVPTVSLGVCARVCVCVCVRVSQSACVYMMFCLSHVGMSAALNWLGLSSSDPLSDFLRISAADRLINESRVALPLSVSLSFSHNCCWILCSLTERL